MSSNNTIHILRKVNTQKDIGQYMDIDNNNYRGDKILYSRHDNKKSKIKKKSVFKINSTIQEGRKEIYTSYSIKEQISLTYDLILRNRKELISFKEDNKILNPSTD